MCDLVEMLFNTYPSWSHLAVALSILIGGAAAPSIDRLIAPLGE